MIAPLTEAESEPRVDPPAGPRAGRALSRLAPLWAALGFLAVAALVTWPALPNAARALPDAGDPAESIWTLHWIAQALTGDPARLYAAPIFHGFPNALAYDDTSLLPGALLAPLWLAPNHLLFYNLLMWVTLAGLGFTAYLLFRAVTGSEAAGAAGGLVCMVNSYNLAHLSHLNVLSAYLLPLALLALHRLFHPGPRGPSGWAAAGLALAIIAQALSTFYILAYLLIAAAAYVGWQVAVRRAVWRWPAAWRRRMLGQLLLVGLAAGAALALVAAPYLQTQQMLGFARTGAENQAWAAGALDYLSVSLHNRAYARILPHNEVEPLFLGFTALALLLIGVAGLGARRGRRDALGRAVAGEAPFYGALLLLALLLTLGPHVALGELRIPLPYAALAHLPGASALRAPVRAMALVNLCAGLFAGIGAATILRGAARLRLPGPARLLPAGALALALTGAILAEQQVAPLALTPLPATEATIPAVYRRLAAQPDGGPLVEMPVGLGLRDATVESTRMYYQTWHGHPLLNGYSSFRPPTYVEMLTLLDTQYSEFTPEQLGLLQSLDVRYAVYHRADYKRSAWDRVAAGLARYPEVHAAGAFESGRHAPDHLFTVDPRPPEARLRLTLAGVAGAQATVRITNPYRYPLLARLRPTLDLRTADGALLSVSTPLLIPPGSQTFAAVVSGPALRPGVALRPLAPAPPTLEP
jgi:hypothetical protein